jgi:ribosomal-protein-alanine N-acetyltransferase
MNLRYETEHLILSIGNESFAEQINAYLIRNREDFSRWDMELNDSYFTMEYQLKAVQAEQRLFMKGEGARYYLFLKGDMNYVIGNVTFGLMGKKGERLWEIGYKTDFRERGKGYAHEAAAFLIPKIAQEFKVKSIYAEILPENRPSVALIEKLGFGFEKVLRGAHKVGGRNRDLLLYRLDAEGNGEAE